VKTGFKVCLSNATCSSTTWGIGALQACHPSEVHHTALALGTLLRRAEEGYRGAWEQAGVDVDGPMGAYSPTPASAGDAFAARHGYILLQKDVHSLGSAATAALRREGVGEVELYKLNPVYP
jgi:hypothetical protein